METPNLFEVEISNVGCIISGVACYEISHFRERTHYHHDKSLCLCDLGKLVMKSKLTFSYEP